MKAFFAAHRAGRQEAALQTGLSYYSSTPSALGMSKQERRPHFGFVTLVGREEATTKSSPFATAASSSAQKPSASLRLMHRLGAHPKPILFDGHGVPVDGSLLALPTSEQFRLLIAMLVAFAVTKATHDVLRYECVYHDLWNTNWRRSADLWRRTRYYGGFTLATLGLAWLYAVSFLAAATVVGRNRLAARLVCRSASVVLPQRTVSAIARQLHL